mmetsp:Transcript_73868/g.216772  ORF Transcript_73868/g.216772 Transcript_73868/m.216772 type:complete len:206 (-) Transcript_73868:161-778(-)
MALERRGMLRRKPVHGQVGPPLILHHLRNRVQTLPHLLQAGRSGLGMLLARLLLRRQPSLQLLHLALKAVELHRMLGMEGIQRSLQRGPPRLPAGALLREAAAHAALQRLARRLLLFRDLGNLLLELPQEATPQLGQIQLPSVAGGRGPQRGSGLLLLLRNLGKPLRESRLEGLQRGGRGPCMHLPWLLYRPAVETFGLTILQRC